MKIYEIKETIRFKNKDYIIIITKDNKIFKYGRKPMYANEAFNESFLPSFPYLAVCNHGATRIRSKDTQLTNDDLYSYVERLDSTQLFEEILES